GGQNFLPSVTWRLASQKTEPVTVDAMGNVTANRTPLDATADVNGNGVPDLVEFDGLWKGLQPLFQFLEGPGLARGQTLVAFAFTTQTVTDPIDPDVTGSLANTAPTTPLLGAQSVTGALTAEQFLQAQTAGLCPPAASCCSIDNGPLPCQAV